MMSELAQDLHLKEIELSTRLIDRVERQLNGELAGVPPIFGLREEFEPRIWVVEIPKGSWAAVILTDVSVTPVSYTQLHLESVIA